MNYPIRPTFPLSVVSPSGSVRVGRQGASVTVDIDTGTVANALPPTMTQFYGALEAFMPGASATLQAAVPSAPSDPVNRAYTQTAFATAGSTLLTFIATTLNLSGPQIAALLAQAALQPK